MRSEPSFAEASAGKESEKFKGGSLYLLRITGLILLVALAAVFFYSAYSKSGIRFQGFYIVPDENAFDNFQWTLLDLGISSVTVAGIIARLLIGFELMLGLFLLCHIALKRFTYPAIIVLLSVFIIYLIAVLIKQGNTGNCGCFGDNIAMKPMAAIWKNLLMIAGVVLLRFLYPGKYYKRQELVAICAGMFALTIPFIVNPPDSSNAPEPYAKAINLSLLYKESPVPAVDLRQGKHIVAFMSLTCHHCKKAAYLLQIIYKAHPDLPIFLVLNGAPEHLEPFFKETFAENVPHFFCKNIDAFIQLVGAGVPAIYWVNNGNIEYRSSYYQLDPRHMEKWAERR